MSNATQVKTGAQAGGEQSHHSQGARRGRRYLAMLAGVAALSVYALDKGASSGATQTTTNTVSDKGVTTTVSPGGAILTTPELAPPGTLPPRELPTWMDTLAPGTAPGDGPLPATQFMITGYAPQPNDPTRSRISMAWNTGANPNPSAVTTVVLRAPSTVSATYTTVAYYETAPTNELRSFTDQGAIAGQYNCYWVVNRNAVTNTATGPLCVFGPTSNTVQVTRARVTMRAGDVSDGGTDSAVAVALQPAENVYATLPRGNITWLDTQYDDFERGDTRTYDLLPRNLRTTNDVTALRVEVSGDDDLCLSDLSVRLNEEEVFTRNYSPCVWVSEKQPLYEDIRPGGVLAPVNQHIYITYEYLDEIIEAILGDSLHGQDASWNQVSGRNPQGYPVDDTHRFYRAWLFGYGFLPFEVEIVLRADSGPCVAGTPQRLSIVTEYVDTDADEWLPFLEPLVDLIADYIPEIPPTSFNNPLGCGRLIFTETGFGLDPL